MGLTCPHCGTHQAIVQNLAASGQTVEKAEDVLIKVLACGHSFGTEEFNEYARKVKDIDGDMIKQIQDIKATRNDTIKKMYESVKSGAKTMRAK